MPSTNITVHQVFDSCSLMGSFAWRDEYLTHAVYINIVILTTINGVSFPFTAIFNGLLMFYIIRRPTLRKKKSTVVIGYQAVTDLAVGVIVQPTFIATELRRITGQCRICTVDSVLYYLTLVTCASSIDHLILIAWERYTAIKHPLRYRLIVTTNRLVAATILTWFVEITLNGVFFFGISSLFSYDIILMISIPFCFSIIVYFYTIIYLESKRHQVLIMTSTPQQGMNRLIKKEFKAAKTTALVVGCLLTCYAPTIGVLITVNFIFPINSSNASVWACIFPWVKTFALLNSLINPLIYGWRVQEIREVVASTFKWRENSLRQELRTDMMEMVEFNRKRINLGFVSGDEEFVSGPLAGDPRPLRNPSKATQLITETCVYPNGEANGECRCASKLQLKAHTSLTDEVDSTNSNHNIGDDADLESDFELNERFLEGKESKKEQNQITVTAIVHCNPVTNNEVFESIIENGDIDSNTEGEAREAVEKRGNVSKLQLTSQTSPTDEVERTNHNHNIGEYADSENDLELNERFSKEEVQHKITVTEIVHCNEVSESIIEDNDILPGRITLQKRTTEIAEKESSLACSVKSEVNTETPENLRLGEIDDLFPTLATIIERLEKEVPDRMASIRQQNIEAERIEVIDSLEY